MPVQSFCFAISPCTVHAAWHATVAALKVQRKRTETPARLFTVDCSEVVHARANLRGGTKPKTGFNSSLV